MENEQRSEQHLAWHETLEVHELVGLMKLKKAYQDIIDPMLQELYTKAIVRAYLIVNIKSKFNYDHVSLTNPS